MRSRNRQIYEKHGNLFFVTSTVVGSLKIFKIDSLCKIMTNNLAFYQDRGDFTILAYVIMPNHFHLVLKTNDKSISKCMGNLKRITSREISAKLKSLGEKRILAELDKATALEPTDDSKIWENRFDSLVIVNEDTLCQKIDYNHYNPIKAGLVSEPNEWLYSSARNYEGSDDVVIPVDTEWKCLDYGFKPSGNPAADQN